MALFDITVPSDTVGLAERKGDVTFSVKNTSDRLVTGRAYFPKMPSSAQKQAPEAWLSAANPERAFDPGQTHQFVVRVAVPADGTVGEYVFRLGVCEVERPDDEFTEGPPVAFEVKPAPAPPKDYKWLWWVLVAAGVVLIGVVLAIWQPWKRATTTVPDLANKPLDEARRLLEAGKYQAVVADLPEADRAEIPPNLHLIVRGQKQAPGIALPAGSPVEVTVWRAVTLPVGKGVDFDKDDDPLVDPAAAGADVTLTRAPASGGTGTPAAQFGLVGGTRCAVVQLPGNAGAGAATARFGFVTGMEGMALAPGGEAVAVGQTLDIFQQVLRGKVVVARYLPDGRVDPAYATSGRIGPAWSAVGFEPPSGNQAVVAGPDGKVCIAGTVGKNLAVVRLGTDGELDTSFNNSGLATIAVANENLSIAGVAQDAAGRVVVAGWSGASDNKVVLAALQANGLPDANFGQGGTATAVVPGFVRPIGGPLLRPDGSIVLVMQATRAPNGPQEFGFVKFNSSGAPGTSPWPGGIRFNFGGSDDIVAAVANAGGGKILLAGSTTQSAAGVTKAQFAIRRFTTDLGVDPTFGSQGRAVVDGKDPATGTPFKTVQVGGVAATRAGGVVIGGAGTFQAPAPPAAGTDLRQPFMVVRVDAAGRPETGFAGSGVATLPSVSTFFNGANAIAVDENDRTVAGGILGGGCCVARFLPNGTLDPTFGGPLRLREVWDGRADPELFTATFPFGGVSAGTTVLLRTAAGRSVLARVDEPLDPAAGQVKFSYMAWSR